MGAHDFTFTAIDGTPLDLKGLAGKPVLLVNVASYCGFTPQYTAKQKVIGADAHPLYKWIAAEAGEGAAPRWNFHKYLIGKDGSLLGAWPSRVRPASNEITSAIEAAL